jgi:hypothetical protein
MPIVIGLLIGADRTEHVGFGGFARSAHAEHNTPPQRSKLKEGLREQIFVGPALRSVLGVALNPARNP